jgi:hypothetical protein
VAILVLMIMRPSAAVAASGSATIASTRD